LVFLATYSDQNIIIQTLPPPKKKKKKAAHKVTIGYTSGEAIAPETSRLSPNLGPTTLGSVCHTNPPKKNIILKLLFNYFCTIKNEFGSISDPIHKT